VLNVGFRGDNLIECLPRVNNCQARLLYEMGCVSLLSVSSVRNAECNTDVLLLVTESILAILAFCLSCVNACPKGS
jgi:hypothetical protein